jgi:hypothetical protein
VVSDQFGSADLKDCGAKFFCFAGADAIDLEKLARIRRTSESDCRKCAVVEDAIGRDAQTLGLTGAPFLEASCKGFLFVGEADRCGLLRGPRLFRCFARGFGRGDGCELFGDAVADQQVCLQHRAPTADVSCADLPVAADLAVLLVFCVFDGDEMSAGECV